MKIAIFALALLLTTATWYLIPYTLQKYPRDTFFAFTFYLPLAIIFSSFSIYWAIAFDIVN